MSATNNPVNSTSSETSWHLDDMKQLCRFLILGSEAGSYQPDKKDPSKNSISCLHRLIENGQGLEAVKLIRDYSVEGRIAKQQPAIFALAVCAKQSKDVKTKQAAFTAFLEVCRTSPHLFQFIEFSEKLSDKSTGWGRAQRKAINKWYNSKEPKQLALAVTKYRSRIGWSHRDVLRLSHVKPKQAAVTLVLKYVAKGLAKAKEGVQEDSPDDVKAVLKYLEVVETVKHSTDEQEVARLVEEYHLVHDQLATWHNKSQEVWRALLPSMPMEALIRNLSKLTSLNLLDSGSKDPCVQIVVDRLHDEQRLKEARVHPFTLLLALKTYEKGEGEKAKKHKWTPNPTVKDSLSTAFYNSFKSIEATNKRFLLAIDISGSMRYGTVSSSSQLTPAVAAAAMAMVTVRTEKHYEVVVFSQGLKKIDVTPTMTLDEIEHRFSEFQMGGTDCSLPIQWALDNKKEVDVFIIYTDCDVESQTTRPADILRQYRTQMNLPETRFVVCALTSSNLTLADPKDAGMLDIEGFDAAAPQVIHNFVMGQL